MKASHERTNFMNSKSQSTIPYLISISLFLFANLVLSTRSAIAQDQSSTSQNPCGCWIDVKTGKRVATVPLSGKNINPNTIADPGLAILSVDGKTAFNDVTKQNFALVPCPPP